jgi:carboxyl-terminal processing protease
MKTKNQILFPLLFAFMVVFGMWAGSRFNPYHKSKNNISDNKISEVIRNIEKYYVDTIDQDRVVDDAITKLLQDLDPHSYYIQAKDVKAVQQDLEGNFEGIGVEFNILRDTIIIVAPISGGPSEALGILAGDKIIYIEDENVAGIGIQTSDVREKLLGKKGTEVKIRIMRNGQSQLLDFTLKRDKIPLFSVDAYYLADPTTGYIKVNRFSATTYEEFISAMHDLQSQGMKNLILDLSGNPGGYMDAANKLINEFFSSRKLIVYTEGRMLKRENSYSNRHGDFTDGKLIVLVDEGSASASEILAGAVQDWDRGIIIGRKTFGKALVQKEFMLSDQSVIRLTIARYYTPMGRFIQKPYTDGNEEYFMEMYERFTNGEVYFADSNNLNDSLRFTTANGREMYGGGGIMPDIFVAIDTTGNTNYLNQLIRNGCFTRFVLNYLDENRKALLLAYPEFETFDKQFKTKNILDDFIAFSEKDVKKEEKELNRSEEIILLQLKALIARQLYDNASYYRVFNQMNPKYIKAVEVMHSDLFDKLRISSRQ